MSTHLHEGNVISLLWLAIVCQIGWGGGGVWAPPWGRYTGYHLSGDIATCWHGSCVTLLLLLHIYTVSTLYLHSIYTAVLCSVAVCLAAAMATPAVNTDTVESSNHRRLWLLRKAKSIFITLTRGQWANVKCYSVYLPLPTPACVCYVTMCKM